VALEGWVGWHGQGKTYCAVAHVLDQLDRHSIPVWSNATISGAEHFDTWDDLMWLIEDAIANHKRAQLLIDEAGKFLSSRFFNKIDPRILTVLQERRKVGAGLDLYWTAPSYGHVDKILRDVTQVVHHCRRYGGSEYSHDGGRPPWCFRQKSYRPTDLDDAGRMKTKASPIRKRTLPFSRDLAQLYTTGLVNFSRPMAADVSARPDYRTSEDRPADAPSEVVVKVNAR